MAWLGKLGAIIVVFIGSVFGSSHTPQNPVPLAPEGSQPMNTITTPNNALGAPANTTSGGNTEAAVLMRQLGCHDTASCIAVCSQSGSPALCQRLENIYETGNSDSAHTAPSQSGNAEAASVMQKLGCHDTASCVAVCSGSRSSALCKQLQNMYRSGGSSAAVGTPVPETGAYGAITSVAGACSASKQLFTVSPVPIDKISTIVPLGNFEPHSHIAPTTQIYIRYLHDQNGPALTTLYAPADMTVTQITRFDNNSASVPFDSYRLDFTVCDGRVSGYFILVLTLNDKLAAAFHQPYDYTQTTDVGLARPDHSYRKDVSVNLKAGEVLGTAGGKSIYPDALDFGLSDTHVPAAVVANPDRWDDRDLHYVCPLDYFQSATANLLYGKLGNFDGKLLTINEPRCGQIYQDKPGTAQGLWFAKASTHPSIFDVSNLLTLGHSNYDHTKGVFVLGNVFRQVGFDTDSVYSFSPLTTGKTNLDFNLVTPHDTYCYQASNDRQDRSMAILIQMIDNHTLRIGKLDSDTCDSGPWQFTKYLDFVR